jgi:hypothetical protein
MVQRGLLPLPQEPSQLPRKGYAQLEKEALALVYRAKHFHKFMVGREFTLVTDHRPLLKILGPQEGVSTLAAARLQRWALLLSAYNYKL